MIIGIGVDIEKNERFNDLDDLSYLRKIFTEEELHYCFSKACPSQSLAARFAGKESVLKALNRFITEPDLLYYQIEILNDDTGMPVVRIKKSGFERYKIFITMSHCDEYSVAFSIIKE